MLTDFGKVLPPGKVSRDGRPGTWHLVDYRTRDGSGVMIQANPDAHAPEIEIELPLQGRYEVFLGFFKNYGDRLMLRLAGARCFERLAYSYPFGDAPCFQDVFWRTVELNGTDKLQIRQDGANRAAVGYVLARKSSPSPTPKRQYLLHVTDDGWPKWGVPLDREDASWIVEPMARLGAQYVSRGCDIAGMAHYYTRHASLQYDCERALRLTFVHESSRRAVEILRNWQRERYAVPRRYYELARECGMEPLGYCRMAHIHAAPPYNQDFSTLYDRHPEFRCIDISGAPVCRLSIAFPEVRREFIKLFTEQVEMGAAGVNNVFVRGLPMVLYEDPVRERFRELHGGDMSDLPENDPRAQAVRAEFMTVFMREQREAMDRTAGGHATIMVTVPSNQAVCDFFGLDIRRWIRERLVDIVCPYRFGFDARDHMKLDLDFFCEAVKGSGVLLLPHIRTWADNVDAMMANALQYCRWPIDGFSVWDAKPVDPMQRRAIEGLATQEGICDAIEALKRGPKHRSIITVGSDGALLNKYSWGWNN